MLRWRLWISLESSHQLNKCWIFVKGISKIYSWVSQTPSEKHTQSNGQKNKPHGIRWRLDPSKGHKDEDYD